MAMRAAPGRRRMQREPVVHSLPCPVKHPPGSPMKLAGDDQDMLDEMDGRRRNDAVQRTEVHLQRRCKAAGDLRAQQAGS